jgi:hypothetical protein
MAHTNGVPVLHAGAGWGKDLLRVAAATALVLLAPLIAMGMTRQVQWSAFDFGAAAVLLLAAGLACVRTARSMRRRQWRRPVRIAAVGVLVLAVAALWVELAVGVFFGLGS